MECQCSLSEAACDTFNNAICDRDRDICVCDEGYILDEQECKDPDGML